MKRPKISRAGRALINKEVERQVDRHTDFTEVSTENSNISSHQTFFSKHDQMIL